MLDFESALEIINKIPQPAKRVKSVDLCDAPGYILSEDVLTKTDHPPFDKSAMDGFAMLKEDDSEDFEIIDFIAAGDVSHKEITVGTCAKIMTGAMLPKGAGRVVRVEFCAEESGRVKVLTPEKVDNIIRQGENLEKGSTAVFPKRLGPQDIGIIASCGNNRVSVFEPLKVAVLATGSEIKDPGDELGPGQIYNSNESQLIAQVKAAGEVPVSFGIIPDDPVLLCAALRQAKEQCDVILLTGGVSMGELDFVPGCVQKQGGEILFHKLKIKPGKPAMLASFGNTYALGLPGNPVSVFILFELLVKPLFMALRGLKSEPSWMRLPVACDFVRKNAERREFLPGILAENGFSLLSYKGSSNLEAMSRVVGLLSVPAEKSRIHCGEICDVRLL